MTRIRARLERLYAKHKRRAIHRKDLERLSDDDLLEIIADGDSAHLARLRTMPSDELEAELRVVGRL